MVAEVRALADLVRSRNVTQPITLEHVGKAKIIFDAYIVYKAATYIRVEIESGNLKPEYGSETDKVKPPSADATLGMGIRRSPSF